MPLVAKAEVGDLGVVVGVEEEVAQLQVPEHHAPLVAVLQSRDQLAEWASGLPIRLAAFGFQVGELVSPAEVLHYYKQSLLSINQFKEFHNIWVVYNSQAINLSKQFLEPGEALICLVNGLDGYHSHGQNMPGQLHFGKVAFTNCLKYLIIINMSNLVSGDGHKVLHL